MYSEDFKVLMNGPFHELSETRSQKLKWHESIFYCFEHATAIFQVFFTSEEEKTRKDPVQKLISQQLNKQSNIGQHLWNAEILGMFPSCLLSFQEEYL